MFKSFNPNPVANREDDCTVRAVSLALGTDWETTYFLLAINGAQMGLMMDTNGVWWSVLRQNGFYRKALPETCPDCYTVRDFCADHPNGVFVIGTDRHVVTAIDGDWYDLFDCGDETVLYFWYRKDE